MNASELREHWTKMHDEISIKALLGRDSMYVPFKMLSEYDSLPPEEKPFVFPLLSKWLLSDDNCSRYDAAFIISERNIHELAPAVQKALDKWERIAGPEAYHEAKNLRRILNELTEQP